MKELYSKYDQRAPRYTSYPAMPFWKNNIDQKGWLECLQAGLKDDPSVDLYLHVPFCEKLCWYCGCNRVITKNKQEADKYLAGLISEFEQYIKAFPHLKIRSMHFGGGTPNFLTIEQMEKLLLVFRPYMLADEFEGAIEVDPRTCEKEHLALLGKFGFKRVSFGVQDFDPEVQKAINREQSFELVKNVCEEAKKNGFDHINFDLIWGLPKQSVETIAETARLTKILGPDQISFYSYAHLPSKFKHQNLIKASDILEGEQKRALYDCGKKLFEECGYCEIGMDHYSKKDSLLANSFKEKKLTRNFMGYTDKKSSNLVGLGASSISSNSYGFIQNEKSVGPYLKRVSENSLALSNGHLKVGEDDAREKIIQDLMCNLKLDKTNLEKLANWNQIQSIFAGFEKDGLLVQGANRYNITATGKVFIRTIASSLDEYYQNAAHDGQLFSKTI